jgi:hypothetical protein
MQRGGAEWVAALLIARWPELAELMVLVRKGRADFALWGWTRNWTLWVLSASR